MLNRILGFLGWFGSLLVFVAVGVWIVRPDLDTLRRALAFAGLANILLYGAGHWRRYGHVHLHCTCGFHRRDCPPRRPFTRNAGGGDSADNMNQLMRGTDRRATNNYYL